MFWGLNFAFNIQRNTGQGQARLSPTLRVLSKSTFNHLLQSCQNNSFCHPINSTFIGGIAQARASTDLPMPKPYFQHAPKFYPSIYSLKFLKTKGCLGMHSNGNLCLGSFFKSLAIKSLASSGIPLGHRISTL